MSGAADWQNSFVVRSDGQPGDVITKMMFKAAGSLPNIEILGKDELHTQTAGDHPWSVQNGMRSTLYIFNHSSSEKEVTVRLGSGRDIWLKLYSLLPNETRAISINDVIDSKMPDMAGRIMPANKATGEAGWWAPSGTSPQVSGRVVQVDAAGTMARNFSCYNYEGLCALSVLSDPLDLPFQTDGGLGSSTTFCMYPSAPNSCPNDGEYAASGTSLTWAWTSGNTSIASITSGATTATSNWQGVSGGRTSSSLTAKVTSNQQNTCRSGGGVNVIPKLSLGNALFFNNGIALPSTFTEAQASAVLTATGASGGSFSWSISSSSGSIASFSSSSAVLTETTSGNTATIYAIGPSKSNNDVNINLSWTPPGGTAIVAATTTAIDSPYRLTLSSQSALTGARTCNPFTAGNLGWETQFTWEMISFFNNPLLGMDLNEQFTNVTVYQTPGYGYVANGTAGIAGKYTFTDTYCAAINPDGNITTEPPQNPLLTNPVDSATQTYRLGSTTVGSGTSVQTQTLTRYQDHITVTNIAR